MNSKIFPGLRGFIRKFIHDTKAVTKIKVKELIVFFLTFLAGSWAGNYVLAFFNVRGSDWISVLIGGFVPAAIIYVVWIKWTRKYAGHP